MVTFLCLYLIHLIVTNAQCSSGELEVTLTACPGFTYYGGWNTLSMQVQGSEFESEWFVINDDDTLPSSGNSNTYCIDRDFSDIGTFIWFNIQAFESELFCMTQLDISYDNGTYIYSESFDTNYLGDGIYLIDECDFSFVWLSDSYPLLPCFDSSFTIRTYQTRTIYDFEIHTCLRKESATSVLELQTNIEFGLMMQQFNDTTWLDAGTFRLDHFQPNTANDGYNIKRVGELSAVDYKLQDNRNGNDFTTSLGGTLVALRIVLKNGDYVVGFGTDNVGLDNAAVVRHRPGERNMQVILSTYQEDDVQFGLYTAVDCLEFNDEGNCTDLIFYQPGTFSLLSFIGIDSGFLDIVPGENMVVWLYNENSGGFTDIVDTDIYLVFLEEAANYHIPYLRLDLDSNVGFTAFKADEQCRSQYGTNLASVHNELSHSLSLIYCKNAESCWIGAYNNAEDGSDDGFWRWLDGTGSFETNESPYDGFWAGGEPNDDDNLEDCIQILSNDNDDEKWNDQSCTEDGVQTAICNSPYWQSDQTRRFQFNIDDALDQIVLMSISNSGTDPFCVDYVQGTRINNDHTDTQSSVKIGPSNWVGIENTEVDEDTGEVDTNICSFVECTTSTYAMFTLPVCEINIVDTELQTPDYDTISYDGASITGLSCTNRNRFINGECDVSQVISVTEETTVELEHTTTSGSEDSWSVGVGVEINVGLAETNNFPWFTVTGSFEYTETSWEEESETRTEGFTSSETKDVSCTGSVSVPPNHEIAYDLTIKQEIVSVKTLNTLELVLCSAFLTNDDSDGISEESGDIVYQYNVPGETVTVTASVCEVTFGTATRVTDIDLTCSEAQALAIRTGATYMPLCQNDTDLWDGCQCETGDKLTEAPCYCVDEIDGSVIGGDALFSEDDDWRDTCRSLSCENSIYQAMPTFSPTAAPSKNPTMTPTMNPSMTPTQSPTPLAQNIFKWILDDADTDNGLVCLISPDIDNPCKICIQLDALSLGDELCNAVSSSSKYKFDDWKDYDWTSTSYYLNEPPNPDNANIQVVEINVVMRESNRDIELKILYFYNFYLSRFENGITVALNTSDGWPFSSSNNNQGSSSDNYGSYDNVFDTLIFDYGVYLEGKCKDEESDTTQESLENNANLYYNTYFGYEGTSVKTNLVEGGIFYLAQSNNAFYDGLLNRVGVCYDDELDDKDNDMYNAQLCFHAFDNSLDYNLLVNQFA